MKRAFCNTTRELSRSLVSLFALLPLLASSLLLAQSADHSDSTICPFSGYGPDVAIFVKHDTIDIAQRSDGLLEAPRSQHSR